MPTVLRQKRVADRLQVEIADLLRREVKDPRLEMVTVTAVNIDRELEHANVFVAAMGDDSRRSDILRALESAKGFIRREVGRRVQLRRTPAIEFHWDASPDRAEHVEQLLDTLKKPPHDDSAA
jgi:ribosome-binding factor A